MNVSFEKGIIFLLLFAAFVIFFWKIKWLALITGLLKQTRENAEEAFGERLLENRRKLREIQKKYSLWSRIEQLLYYSGIRRYFPKLSAEWALAQSMAAGAGVMLLAFGMWNIKGMLIAGLLFYMSEIGALQLGRMRAKKSVNDNLLKFLDFLSNYSITSGEITGTFHQISKYMEEPLKSVLEECCFEAQTTGDVGLALLSMAEKIEHPKFKEFVRNMEINLRYCADFTVLVAAGRKSMRDYLRLREERRRMLQEGGINLLLLLAMSFFVLLAVDKLIEISIWNILFHTVPGWLALAVIGLIVLLFIWQLGGLER